MTADSPTVTDFLVEKANLHNTRFQESTPRELAEGAVLFRIDRFAFTANNVTYAAFGDAMKYWEFFPVPEGCGKIPVWGFADVVVSNHAGVQVGERFYGYFPMSSHLVVSPAHVTPAGFADGAAHRAGLPPVYNYYNNCAGDAGYVAALEDLQSLFRPLFMTSFLIDDFMADNGFFGAVQVVLSSASSKTAFGTAFQLAKRGNITVIGLTSPGNVAFTESLGCYDRVVTYDDVGTLDASSSTVFIDMAGSATVRTAVHTHFGHMLKHSCAVGASHWDEVGSNRDLPGPAPTLFFAPAQGQKRVADWGLEGFQKNTAAAWLDFIKPAAGWIDVKRHTGRAAIEQVYNEMLDGRANPKDGHILSY